MPASQSLELGDFAAGNECDMYMTNCWLSLRRQLGLICCCAMLLNQAQSGRIIAALAYACLGCIQSTSASCALISLANMSGSDACMPKGNKVPV